MRSLIVLLALMWFGPEAWASCGAGCRQAMGNCRVDSDLWQSVLNARNSGVRVTSCCRSPAYNRQLRACGYFPAVSSRHMSGEAVDLIVSPARCNARSLTAYGFAGVCPHYHYGHCHIQKCGTSRTLARAQERARQQARQIRAENRRVRPVGQRVPVPKPRPEFRESQPQTSTQGFMFTQPSWWEMQDTGATR